MERDQQGYTTTNGLFAIINTLGRLPGRKSLVLFSEGIAIPPAVQRLFLGVIDAANRANVSIYTMDAAGLRAESEQRRPAIRSTQRRARRDDGGYVGRRRRRPADQRAREERGRAAPGSARRPRHSWRRTPAGCSSAAPNNLRQGFERIESDLRNYYLLGYTPSNGTFDGRFRDDRGQGEAPRRHGRGAQGLLRVRNPGGAPINAWEAPALGALEQKPVPNAFPVRAGALLFPERGTPGLVPVVVELKTAPLTFLATADGKTYTSDFTVLVRFLDGTNQVVRKVSQHYEVRGPIAQIERAKQRAT